MIGRRLAFLIAFAVVVAFIPLGWAGVTWIDRWTDRSSAAAAPLNPAFVKYTPATGKISAASNNAMTAYTAANPQPRNVQVLRNMTTAEIAGYMVSNVSGGLGVDCTFCHNLGTNNNFADDTNPNKAKARTMLQMSADLNQNWITRLPASVGEKQVTCATCHNGKNSVDTYPTIPTIPESYRLPYTQAQYDALRITGKDDPSLNAVRYNQWTMTYMNYSLGVGCTFCHDASYFPSAEKPQRGYATTMVQMVQYLNSNSTYKTAMNNKQPSCWMCHQGNNLPPGAANSARDLPAVLAGTRR